MKVPHSVRERWQEFQALAEELRPVADSLLRSVCESRWHYESRIKQLESFAQKLETGRFTSVDFDDFFACTLVVPNRAAVSEAEARVRASVNVRSRKPPRPGRTHKEPSAFPFDDLRLGVQLRPTPGRPRAIDQLRFEVQVKTFFQHAWSIATHDLVYKGDDVSWPLERIAFQIKAMLEHAESAIDGADGLSRSGVIRLTDAKTERLRKTLAALGEYWSADELPADRVRLAKTVVAALDAFALSPDQLREILRRETDAGRGSNIASLSPYNVVVLGILRQQPAKVAEFIAREDEEFRIFVPRELRELAPELGVNSKRIVFETAVPDGHE